MRKGKSMRYLVGLAIVKGLIALSCVIGGGDNGGPKLPDNLTGVPIVEGVNKACEVFGCPK